MNNLSFHITDIVANSIRAGATEVFIVISVDTTTITLEVKDNGCGMDADTIRRVTDPFYTTRTTRKVGLGLPFLIQNAEQTGGSVILDSTPGKGTTVTARFISTHIDCPPWGDLPATIATTLTGNPEVNINFRYKKCESQHRVVESTEEPIETTFSISTEDLKEALGDTPLSLPQVTLWVTEMIKENIGG